MNWAFGGVQLITQDNSSSNKAIIARLQPISGGTTLQIFGYEDPIVKISAIIVGTADRDTLEGFAKSDSSHSLVTPYGTISYYLASFNSKQRLGIISQSIIIDGSHDCLDPVFDVELELYS